MRLAALPGLAAAALALATASAASPAPSRTILVTSITVKSVSHDIGPKGPSAGDTVVYADRLVNAAAQFGKGKGERVGADRGTALIVASQGAVLHGTTTLPGGTLTISGPITPLANGGLTVAVTKGTGAFAHMRGTLIVGPGKTRALNTYRLTRASSRVA
ncbi:MAG TPA: hypothetical protein VGM80_16355 [Gaiellaceae bacterium]|jgi:hypothetical protein